MNIYKFGGASVKDADGVKNVAKVLNVTGTDNKVVVISAMGKTTNALEGLIHSYFNDATKINDHLDIIYQFHFNIINELFSDKKHQVVSDVDSLFADLKRFLEHNKSPKYDFVYDQIVSYGELLSTTIISAYLNDIGVTNIKLYPHHREVISIFSWYAGCWTVVCIGEGEC